jgi:RNA polymerase sigma-70 factor (ECF subfamily)
VRRSSAQKARDANDAARQPAQEPIDESLLRREERDQVRSALTRLTALQREAVELAYYGGRTYREVAEELEIPEGTAKSRLRDGLRHLRVTLGGGT